MMQTQAKLFYFTPYSTSTEDCLCVLAQILFRATCFHFPSIETLFEQEPLITRVEQCVAMAKMQQTVTETTGAECVFFCG